MTYLKAEEIQLLCAAHGQILIHNELLEQIMNLETTVIPCSINGRLHHLRGKIRDSYSIYIDFPYSLYGSVVDCVSNFARISTNSYEIWMIRFIPEDN